jgi:hypothetical protein
MTRRRLSARWLDKAGRNHYNINDFFRPPTVGDFGIPQMEPCAYVPKQLFPFDEKHKWREGLGDCISFFCDDCEFENVWLRANRDPHMPAVIEKIGCTLTPDFSLYRDWETAVLIWQTYRTRFIGSLWQSLGINTIPTVSWATPGSYRYCFDGLPVGGSFAIATVELNDARSAGIFVDGYREFLHRCQPDTVLIYGQGFKGLLESDAERVGARVVRYRTRLHELRVKQDLAKAKAEENADQLGDNSRSVRVGSMSRFLAQTQR